MHILQYFYEGLPFSLLTPGPTKERQTPNAHSLPAYSIHVTSSFTPALHCSRFPHSIPEGRGSPKPSRTCTFEMLSRSTKTCLKPKRIHRSPPNNKETAIKAFQAAACHCFQRALILGFSFIIIPYHSKACRYLCCWKWLFDEIE